MPASSAAVSSRSPRCGVAPSSATRCEDESLRASATTGTPRARSTSMSRPPTKPEPPVTKAFCMAAHLNVGSPAMADSEIHHPDGRVELRAPEELESSPLYNHDLAPVSVARR